MIRKSLIHAYRSLSTTCLDTRQPRVNYALPCANYAQDRCQLRVNPLPGAMQLCVRRASTVCLYMRLACVSHASATRKACINHAPTTRQPRVNYASTMRQLSGNLDTTLAKPLDNYIATTRQAARNQWPGLGNPVNSK